MLQLYRNEGPIALVYLFVGEDEAADYASPM